MFNFGKKKEKEETFKQMLINDFDEQAYLDANPDVVEGIANGQFKDALHHLETFGLNEIEEGVRRFHKGFESFDESRYLEAFADLNPLLEEGKYSSVFDHFCRIGYKEIIEGNAHYMIYINKEKNLEQEKIIAILGIPRSGLTLTASLLGGNCNASTWFLPYGTRKELGIEPFTDFTSIRKAYAETFPEEKILKNTLFISESTADEKNIDFIVESLKNLENSGVEVHILWLTRDIHHTYVSQMETAFQYWGAEELTYDKNTYKTYVDFAKHGYLKITDIASDFNTSLIAYEKLAEEPFETIQAIFRWLGIDTNIDTNNLLFEHNHVAGDPSFQPDIVRKNCSKIREENWSALDYLDESLDTTSKLFVDTVKKRTKTLLASQTPFPFESYKEILLEKYFDNDYYLDHNDDIKIEGLDPIEHYKIFGWKENRNPSREFETKWYRENIFDDGETPSFLHFLLRGRFLTEPGRSIGIMENLKLIDPKKYPITDDLLLEAPKFDNPEVSIIIPMFNEQNYTLACVESIICYTDNVSYEIIIMDDCSSEKEAREIGKYMKNILFHSNDENLGFIRNCNEGAKFANGNYIMLLNNDTNVQPGWLSSLVDLIDPTEKIGMVGSKLVYPSGELQDAGGIVWNDASGWNFGRLDDPNSSEYNYVRETDYLTGAALLIWKPLWLEIGGFDELYVPAYYDDPDLAFEVRKAGYKVLYQPKSVIIHFEGITNGTDLGSGVKQYQVVNREKFYDKWKKELIKNQFPNAKDVFLARDRSANKKHMLFVDHYLPHYDEDAGSKAALDYLKMFVKNGIQVHFIGDNFYDYPETPYLETLTQMGIEVLYGEWYKNHWQEWIENNGQYLDYIILSRPHIAEKYIDIVREKSAAKIIYFGHDLHFLRERREYEIKRDKTYLLSSMEWLKRELDLNTKADVSYFFSDVEKTEIQKVNPYASVDVVPLYIYDTFKKRKVKSKKRNDIMFVGGFAHSPNIDAMLWFVEKVWSKIEKKIPDAKFYIIGSHPTEEILALAKENIIVTGFVDDATLDDYYKQCKVSVAPLRYGAGIKGKVVDALYNGMPLVTTSIGAEGLDDARSVMMIADTPKKFAKTVLSIYLDDDLADRYAKKAIKYCKIYFSEKRAKSKMSHSFIEFEDGK